MFFQAGMSSTQSLEVLINSKMFRVGRSESGAENVQWCTQARSQDLEKGGLFWKSDTF